jgi:hypothetical protein
MKSLDVDTEAAAIAFMRCISWFIVDGFVLTNFVIERCRVKYLSLSATGSA